MRKADAISYFGTQTKLGAQLGLRQHTISKWPDPIALPWACVIEKMTRGKVRVDLRLYDDVPPGLRGRQ